MEICRHGVPLLTVESEKGVSPSSASWKLLTCRLLASDGSLQGTKWAPFPHPALPWPPVPPPQQETQVQASPKPLLSC